MSQSEHIQDIAVVAGAGPAGLTAAFELATRTGVHPVVYEASDVIGGISRTAEHHGNRIDIGGHRFFSKSDRVMRWWADRMPLQESADPETTDRVMLRRRRVSRIYYLRRFFDYPISLTWSTISNLGVGRTIAAGFGYMKAAVRKRRENSLEDFYINRFGRKLYSMFFEDYTEKVWGLHPSKLGADWGSQRVKGLSVTAIIKDIFFKKLGRRDASKVETSLIEEFLYPKYGPGQLWEAVASDMVEAGGELHMSSTVRRVHIEGRRVVSVAVADSAGGETTVPCSHFISSMPLKDLIAAIDGIDVPSEVSEVAAALPYRDFITVGLLVDHLAIKNETKLRTYADRVPDTWIYVQERDVRLGRIQIFNNWSPYMVADYEGKMWIGLEYFCFEGDDMWRMADADFIAMAIDELCRIGIIDSPDVVEDSVRIRMPKAYPAYHGAYYQLDKVRDFLGGIENLYCVGRNGQHRYNNMDHSMLTAMAAVDAIISGADPDRREAVWHVNTEADYHEEK